MRTNIDIDDELMAEAIAQTGVRTKREAVALALRELIERRRYLKAQERIRELRGIGWEGDLEAMRRD